MLGVYDYTVILTYMSLISGGIGIFLSMSGGHKPAIGLVFLVICGICDSFDGKVARTKKDRTDREKKYGIQIDSLSDLVAFGVLPTCIGKAFLQFSLEGNGRFFFWHSDVSSKVFTIISYVILLTYMLAALIRLAYYNVTEEERQQVDCGVRKYYEGLPVTMSSVIFPLLAIIMHFTGGEIVLPYLIIMFLTSVAFVSKIRVPKPHLSELRNKLAKRGN